jgi:hypothetical protein
MIAVRRITLRRNTRCLRAAQENRRFQWRLTCLTGYAATKITHQWLTGQAGYAGTKSNQKKAAPESRPFARGAPVLPASMWRLRNSTWRGAHNAPHCGTDSVPGGRKLGAESESWAPVLISVDRVLAPAPANELRLTCRQAHSPRRLPLVESSCSARLKGEEQMH